jgi:hypothetical protein
LHSEITCPLWPLLHGKECACDMGPADLWIKEHVEAGHWVSADLTGAIWCETGGEVYGVSE